MGTCTPEHGGHHVFSDALLHPAGRTLDIDVGPVSKCMRVLGDGALDPSHLNQPLVQQQAQETISANCMNADSLIYV